MRLRPILLINLTAASAWLAAVLVIGGCGYIKLLRPSVLKQLNPRVVALVNEMPTVDKPNKALIAKLYALGGLGHAKLDRDGVMRAEVKVPRNQYIWEPAIIVMPQGGVMEMHFTNEDDVHHMALLPSEGEKQVLDLPAHTSGTARVQLKAPGYYWFGCPVADHAGRGMLGFIFVHGDVPQEARLDRPAQRRP